VTAGIPGAGIGGVFYLATALLAPVWMVVCLLTGRRRTPGDWRLAMRHCLLAMTILGVIWLTGWGLGLVLTSRPVATAFPGAPVRAGSAQLLGTAMVYFTLATLAAVLLGVELLRLVVRRRGVAALVVLSCLLPAPPARAQQAPAAANAALAAALARADAAYKSDDLPTAEAEYSAVLSIDPDQSRALFRMGQILGARNARAAAGFYRHYTIVEPTDAWGHQALAETLGRLGRRADAQRAYAAALALAPAEPDIVLGHPRLLLKLGLIDRAIDGYISWLGEHPADADTWRELADAYQRARRWRAAIDALHRALVLKPKDPVLERRLAAVRLRVAPALTASLLAVGETDITTWGPALGGDVSVGETGRLGATYRRRHVSSLGAVGDSQRLGASFTARPQADVQVDVGGGAAWLRADGSTVSTTHVELNGRVRRTSIGGGVALDLRAQHGPLDLTPELIADPVTASQATGTVDVPLTGPFHVRGLGRVARLSRHEERNTRSGFGGGPVVHLAEGVRLAGQWQQIRNSLPSATGYFAPERAELADAGLEFEHEFDNVSLSFDAGAGLQRVQKAGEVMGGWARALRVWSYAAWSVAPGRQLLFELEAYDSQVATIVQTSERWRHASFTISFRATLGS
jgi:tetratricopeptide (TPR) repeat protein